MINKDTATVDDIRSQLDRFTDLINEEPDKDTIKLNDDGTYQFIPISFIEHDIRDIFQGLVQYEILNTSKLFNSITVTARIRVYHPVLLEWVNYDGVGAVIIEEVNTGRYEGTTKVIKKSEENMALPLAYAEAKKNAAKQIGKRFGSDLNRDFDKVGGRPKSAYETPEAEAYVFDIEAKHTKQDLLKLVAAGKITTETMNAYLNKEVVKPKKDKK